MPRASVLLSAACVAVCWVCIIGTVSASFNQLVTDRESEVSKIATQARNHNADCGVFTKCSNADPATGDQCSESAESRIHTVPHCGNILPPGAKCQGALGSKKIPGTCKKAGCKNDKRLNYDEGYTRLPSSDVPTSAQKKKGAAAICWMSKLRSDLVALDKTRVENDVTRAWMYFGEQSSGALYMYPGMHGNGPDYRDDKGCLNYDPRRRPWYVAAASGPKQVALVLDVSGSMNSMSGSETRLELMKNSSKAVLDTLTQSDYFTVVAFQSTAKSLSTTLRRATVHNIEAASVYINDLVAFGGTSFSAGITKARDIFAASTSSDNSNGCTKVIIFLTDGVDSSFSTTSTVSSLKSENIAVVSFSMGSSSATTIPQTLACDTHGVWEVISDGANPTNQMTKYYEMMAVINKPSNSNFGTIIWSNPYEDAGGLGQMISAARSVYTANGNFLGVASVDVLMEDIEKDSTTATVLNNLRSRSNVCKITSSSQLNVSTCPMKNIKQSKTSSGCSGVTYPSSCTTEETECVIPSFGLDKVWCEQLDWISFEGRIMPKTYSSSGWESQVTASQAQEGKTTSKKFSYLLCCGCLEDWQLALIIVGCILFAVGVVGGIYFFKKNMEKAAARNKVSPGDATHAVPTGPKSAHATTTPLAPPRNPPATAPPQNPPTTAPQQVPVSPALGMMQPGQPMMMAQPPQQMMQQQQQMMMQQQQMMQPQQQPMMQPGQTQY